MSSTILVIEDEPAIQELIAVNLSFALPQSSTYISVLLTPRVRLVQLLANIVGLTSVLGAFALKFWKV